MERLSKMLNNTELNRLLICGDIMVNKALIKLFGEAETPIVLSLMITKWNKSNFEDFYYKVSDLMKDSFLGEIKIKSSINKLVKARVLVKKKNKGNPLNQYYNIDTKKLMDSLNEAFGGVKC